MRDRLFSPAEVLLFVFVLVLIAGVLAIISVDGTDEQFLLHELHCPISIKHRLVLNF